MIYDVTRPSCNIVSCGSFDAITCPVWSRVPQTTKMKLAHMNPPPTRSHLPWTTSHEKFYFMCLLGFVRGENVIDICYSDQSWSSQNVTLTDPPPHTNAQQAYIETLVRGLCACQLLVCGLCACQLQLGLKPVFEAGEFLCTWADVDDNQSLICTVYLTGPCSRNDRVNIGKLEISKIKKSSYCVRLIPRKSALKLSFLKKAKLGHRVYSPEKYIQFFEPFIRGQYWRNKWPIWDWYHYVGPRHPVPKLAEPISSCFVLES